MNMTPNNNPAFGKLLEHIKEQRGFDFSGYKRSSLERRILHRLKSLGIQDFEGYIDYLETEPNEYIHLFNTIFINVTDFFRDPEAWQLIESVAIPKIMAAKEPDEPIRVWSAGAASGEEAFTIAMLLAEHLGLEQFKQRVKIYATDIDEDALAKARQVRYTLKEAEAIPLPFREKYLEQAGSYFYIHKELRRRVIFGLHNMVADAPISHIDLLLCRNLLIYFNIETQTRILTRLHFSLEQHGILFLGRSEMLFSHRNLFTPLDMKHRIFAKVLRARSRERAVPGRREQEKPEQEGLVYELPKIREAAADANPIALVAVDLKGTLVLANYKARQLFDLSAADIGKPIQDLKFSYQPVDLRSLIDHVKVVQESQVKKEVAWAENESDGRFFDISVDPLLGGQQNLVGISLSFIDVTHLKQLHAQVEHTNQELETTMEELQSTNEELETTNEELQSTIEELETTNEELQATNEELGTVNEELQATNEELETMNIELAVRTDEINEINAYLNSVLSSISNSVMVVDKDFLVEIWNPAAEDFWGVRRQEALGQSFFSLDFGLPVDELSHPIRRVATGKSSFEKVQLSAINRRGQNVEMEGTIAPLLNRHSESTGVILVFAPLTDGAGLAQKDGEA